MTTNLDIRINEIMKNYPDITKELKQEFKDSVSEFWGLYESAVEYKKAYEDLDKLSKEEWYKKYVVNGDYWVGDDHIYILAKEHYKQQASEQKG